jgi:L-rhamnose-H+ transport protein
MSPLIPGFTLIFLAAVTGGVFAVPYKMQRRFAWENTWPVGFLFALIIIPLGVVSIFLPVWLSAVRAAGVATVMTAIGFGFMWGWGAVTFAVGISSVGLSLGYATTMGIATTVGSIIPMVRRWDAVPGNAKAVILFGIAICIVGVAVCGRAGMLRESAAGLSAGSVASPGTASGLPTRAFLIGLSWCVLSGFLSACANLGFDFAGRVAAEAQRLGAGPLPASIGRWITVYWGGYFAILLGSGYSMIKKGTWKNYFAPGAGRDFGLCIALGCLHFLAQIPYGMGAYFLGTLGTTVGWAVNIASSLLVANLFGFLIGEWKAAPKVSIKTLCLGLATLVIAMVVLAEGNSLVIR